MGLLAAFGGMLRIPKLQRLHCHSLVRGYLVPNSAFFRCVLNSQQKDRRVHLRLNPASVGVDFEDCPLLCHRRLLLFLGSAATSTCIF